jgi:hypothetical protein
MDVLKAEYSNRLLHAVQEPTPENIDSVLQINAEMAKYIHEQLQTPRTNTKELVAKLTKIQADYEKIKKSEHAQATLSKIIADDTSQLQTVTIVYNIYLSLLLFAICVVIFLIFRSSFYTSPDSLLSVVGVGNA